MRFRFLTQMPLILADSTDKSGQIGGAVRTDESGQPGNAVRTEESGRIGDAVRTEESGLAADIQAEYGTGKGDGT